MKNGRQCHLEDFFLKKEIQICGNDYNIDRCEHQISHFNFDEQNLAGSKVKGNDTFYHIPRYTQTGRKIGHVDIWFIYSVPYFT